MIASDIKCPICSADPGRDCQSLFADDELVVVGMSGGWSVHEQRATDAGDLAEGIEQRTVDAIVTWLYEEAEEESVFMHNETFARALRVLAGRCRSGAWKAKP